MYMSNIKADTIKKDNRIIKLRFIAIMAVVFGHSIILYDPCWNLYKTVNRSVFLEIIKHLINTFQMPLFFSISGFCFCYSLYKLKVNDYHEVIVGIIKKAKHLLVPFFVIAVFWMIPIRILCSYSDWSFSKIFVILKKVALGFDCGHLWFLPSLFMIFLISYLIIPNINGNYQYVTWLLVFYIVHICADKAPNLLYLKLVAVNFYWFYLEFVINKFHIIDYLVKYRYYLTVGSGMTILLMVLLEKYLLSSTFEDLCVSIFLCGLYCSVDQKKCSKFVTLISKYSMGIYLLHSPLIYITYAFIPNILPIKVVLINFGFWGSVALCSTIVVYHTKLRVLLGY